MASIRLPVWRRPRHSRTSLARRGEGLNKKGRPAERHSFPAARPDRGRGVHRPADQLPAAIRVKVWVSLVASRVTGPDGSSPPPSSPLSPMCGLPGNVTSAIPAVEKRHANNARMRLTRRIAFSVESHTILVSNSTPGRHPHAEKPSGCNLNWNKSRQIHDVENEVPTNKFQLADAPHQGCCTRRDLQRRIQKIPDRVPIGDLISPLAN